MDSNHAERDEHLRSGDFLDAADHAEARFESTAFVPLGDDQYRLEGDFTLRGVTLPIEIAVTEIGAGEDPWGNFRRGFQGRTTLRLEDFGIDYDLGPAEEVEIILSIEGIRQSEEG